MIKMMRVTASNENYIWLWGKKRRRKKGDTPIHRPKRWVALPWIRSSASASASAPALSLFAVKSRSRVALCIHEWHRICVGSGFGGGVLGGMARGAEGLEGGGAVGGRLCSCGGVSRGKPGTSPAVTCSPNLPIICLARLFYSATFVGLLWNM